MKNKGNIVFLITIFSILFIPTVSAQECHCHNVGVSASVSPDKIHLGIGEIPENLIFNVTIYNSEYCDETDVNLKITEYRTGKVIYYDPHRIVFLPAQEHVDFQIEIPTNQLTGFTDIKGWKQETYKVEAYQQAFYLDWIPWDNYDYVSVSVKPYTLDVSVSGSGNPSLITPGDPLYVVANLNANSKSSIPGTLSVMITGNYVYQKQTKDIEIYHGVASEVFEFDTTGWEPGAYQVMITFPVQPWETVKENNIYEFEVRVPYTLSITRF